MEGALPQKGSLILLRQQEIPCSFLDIPGNHEKSKLGWKTALPRTQTERRTPGDVVEKKGRQIEPRRKKEMEQKGP